MFDLISGEAKHPIEHHTATPTIISFIVHGVLVLAFVIVPLLRVTNVLPNVPTMMAFVAPAAAPPPPPPPPAPSAPRAVASKSPSPGPAAANAAPVVAPAEVRPEAPVPEGVRGALGGVEGGVEGGVPGGIVGGIVANVAPPVLPTPVSSAPVRIGGKVTAPALLSRVDPKYPDVAVAAQVKGIVILEATVGKDGCVESVQVLRSRGMLLDQAAIEALKQWRYTPLVLNGVPTRFVLTVTFTFSVS